VAAQQDVPEVVLVDQARERGFHPQLVSGDKGYDTQECMATQRQCGVTSHVAKNTNGRFNVIDGRTLAI
jgi:IS5 family transposase